MELHEVERRLNEINLELDRARDIVKKIEELEKEKMYWLGVRDALLKKQQDEEEKKKNGKKEGAK